MIRIYSDMVADLFHFGHVNFLCNAKKHGDILIIGIHNDVDVKKYKRTPILTMKERIKVVESCRYVDNIIPNAPLSLTKEYLDKHRIDKVVTVDNRPLEQLKMMYNIPLEYNMLIQIPYTMEISTTDIIKRIKDRSDL